MSTSSSRRRTLPNALCGEWRFFFSVVVLEAGRGSSSWVEESRVLLLVGMLLSWLWRNWPTKSRRSFVAASISRCPPSCSACAMSARSVSHNASVEAMNDGGLE